MSNASYSGNPNWNAQFSVRINEDHKKEIERLFSEIKGLPERIYKRAITRVVSGVKTDVSAAIREVVNIKKKDLDVHIKTKIDAGSGIVSTEDIGVPMTLLGAKQTNKGVSVKIYKKKPAEEFTSAFIATMKSGHKDVWWRKSYESSAGRPVKKPWKKFGRKYRLPIEKIWGPHIVTILQNEPTMGNVLKMAGERVEKAFEQEINFELSKLR